MNLCLSFTCWSYEPTRMQWITFFHSELRDSFMKRKDVQPFHQKYPCGVSNERFRLVFPKSIVVLILAVNGDWGLESGHFLKLNNWKKERKSCWRFYTTSRNQNIPPSRTKLLLHQTFSDMYLFLKRLSFDYMYFIISGCFKKCCLRT